MCTTQPCIMYVFFDIHSQKHVQKILYLDRAFFNTTPPPLIVACTMMVNSLNFTVVIINCEKFLNIHKNVTINIFCLAGNVFQIYNGIFIITIPLMHPTKKSIFSKIVKQLTNLFIYFVPR